jgi:hypothetical protein
MSEDFTPPNGEQGEAYYCSRDEFTRYIMEKVNPARAEAGLQELDLKTAEECYRILNDFALKNKRDGAYVLSQFYKAGSGV